MSAVTTATLSFQVAMDIAYWDAGEASSGRSIWYGIIAVGLLLGATILVPPLPRLSAVTYLGCLPLVWLYEQEQNRNFYSLELSESIST